MAPAGAEATAAADFDLLFGDFDLLFGDADFGDGISTPSEDSSSERVLSHQQAGAHQRD